MLSSLETKIILLENKAESRNLFSLYYAWSQAPKFMYKKQKKMYFETHSAKNTVSKIKSPKFFIGILLLPSSLKNFTLLYHSTPFPAIAIQDFAVTWIFESRNTG
jgi:hypothetical protein